MNIDCRKIVILSVAAIFLVSLTLLPTADVAVRAQEEVVFKYGLTHYIGFNPLTGYSYLMYRGILWTTLYAYNETWGIEPWAAEYAKRIDPLTWEIKLRDDLYWHDGTPVTAEDYKFTWDTLMEHPAAQTRFLRGVERIEVVSEKVLRVHMKHPIGGYAPFLTGVCVPVPKHIWEEKGWVGEKAIAASNAPPEATPIGMGPFKFEDYKPGEYLVLRAFDKFFAGRPKIDVLYIRIFKDVESAMAAFRTGEIDALGDVPVRAARELAKLPGVHLSEAKLPDYDSIYINQYPEETSEGPNKGHPALRDPVVRKALAMAIDKEFLRDLIVPGWVVGYTPIPPFWPEFNPEVKELWPKFNLTEAAKLLDEAGYVDTDGNGIRNDPKSGRDLVFRMLVYTPDAPKVRATEIIKGWLAQIGIKLEVKGGEAWIWDVVVTPPYDWDLEFWGWTVHDPVSCWFPYTSDAIPAHWSSSGYHSSEFDQLYKSLLDAKDYNEYLKTQYELQKHFVENVVEIVLWHWVAPGVWWANKWTGFVEEPGHIYWYGHNAKAFLYIEPVKTPTPTTVVTTVTSVVPTTVITTISGSPTTITTEVTKTSVVKTTVVTTVTAPPAVPTEAVLALVVTVIVIVLGVALVLARRK